MRSTQNNSSLFVGIVLLALLQSSCEAEVATPQTSSPTTADDSQTATAASNTDNADVDAILSGLSKRTPLPSGMSPESFISSSPDPSNWTQQETSYSNLVAYSFSVITGEKIEDDGCAFSTSIDIVPGETDKEEISLYINTNTCQQIVVTGNPTDDVLDITAQDSGPIYGIYNNRNYSAWGKKWWTDPIGIVVNSVTDTVEWRADGICVVGTTNCKDHSQWFSPSGWQRKEHNLRCTANCVKAISSTYDHFVNEVFCRALAGRLGGILGVLFSGDTHAYYNRNYVIGYYNGRHSCVSRSVVTGHCTRFLSLHNRCSGQRASAAQVSGCGELEHVSPRLYGNPTCTSCLRQNCCSEASTCAADSECKGVVSCIQNQCRPNCLNCVAGCEAGHEVGTAELNNLYSCLNDNCFDACNSSSSCYAARKACETNPDCTSIWACWANNTCAPGDNGCALMTLSRCQAMYPNGVSAFQNDLSCQNSGC